MINQTKPRFTAFMIGDEAVVQDEDFGFDAQMVLSGDFVDGKALKYAQAVADALNALEPAIPRKRARK